jgi:pilus assembly protein CpaE
MADKKKIRIMIVDDVVESQKNLARLLSFETDMEVIGFAGTGAQAIEEANKQRPDVILMDINMPDMDGISATQIITKNVPCSVVMISVQSDRDYMRRAMQAGAVDFLPKPPSAEELYATIRNAASRVPQFVEPVIKKDGKDKITTKVGGKILVVYSPQGGAGVTTLAVNIATGLMEEQKKVLVVDANLQFGDIVVYLDQTNERNVIDLVQAVDVLDDEIVQQVVIQHQSGLNVLAAPKRPEEAELVAPASLSKLVRALADSFDYVVVDTAPHLDDVTLGLFEVADAILGVCIPMLPSAKNMRLVLDLLKQIEDININKIVFAVNKVPTDRKTGALDVEQLKNYLKLPAVGVIPMAERAMYDAINRGVPTIVNARNTPGKELKELTLQLKSRLQTVAVEAEGQESAVAAEEKKPKRTGLFGG